MEASLTSPRLADYYEAGPYRIERHCYDANPCKHYVVETDKGLYKLMSSPEIFNIINKYNVNLPHFNYLNGRVKKFCCFTFYKST